MNALADRQDNFRKPPRPLRGRHPRGAQPAGRTRRHQPLRFRHCAEGGGSARRRGLGRRCARRLRRPRGVGGIPGAGHAGEQERARARHPRSIREARRSHPLPSLLPCVDESLDRGRAPFVALDRSGRRRACGASRALLHADASRGRSRLPDHHDLRRHVLVSNCRATSPCNGCRRSRRASTIRATFPPSRSRA